MINSRQIIELIKTEISRTSEDAIRQAYSKLIEKIEVLEDIEVTKMFSELEMSERAKEQEAEIRRRRAQAEFEKAFK
jgi:hypothetical protein